MPRRLLTLLPVVFAAALIAASPAHAQSLQEVYDAARAYDATYLAARSLSDSAQYKLEQVRALNRPNASVSASATRAETDPPPSTLNPTGSRVGSTTTAVTLSGRQPLFNRTNSVTIVQAEKTFEIARADLQTAEQDLILRVAQAYFDVLVARDALSAARASTKAIGEQLASAKRNFEVGTATITDTREAQARYDLATAQEIAADNDLRTKRIALDQLVGKTNVEPRALSVPVNLPATTPANVEEWVTPSQTVHPSVVRALLGQDIAKLETDKARAGHLPTVDAVASLGSSHASGSGATLPGTSNGVTLGVQLSVPVFSGYSVQNRIKETLVLEDKARNDLEAARRGVAQATRVAYYGVQSG
jgi:outer membrane protein